LTTTEEQAPASGQAAKASFGKSKVGGIVYVQPRRAGLGTLVAEFWRYRLLLSFFGLRFIRKRIARTWLGLIWVPLRPAANLGIRIFVFGGLIGVATGGVPYPVFFLVASAAWMLFAESAYWATRSLEINRKLLPRVYVPKLVVVAAAAFPALLEFAMVAIFAALAVLYYVLRADVFYLDLGLHTLLVPAGLLVLVLLGLGVGLMLSGVSARARDVRFGVGYGISFLYFLTPVIYPLTAIPERWRGLAGLNPLTGAIEMVKAGVFPDHPLSLKAVSVTLFWALLLWIPGLWLFDRREAGVLAGRKFRLRQGFRGRRTT